VLNHMITTKAAVEEPRTASENGSQASRAAATSGNLRASSRRQRIWIDLDNSPHVPFFLPIIEELENRGFEILLTARDAYQVCDLLKFYHLPCKVIGGHSGKNKALKVLVNSVRALQLAPSAVKGRPDLALSHGSRAQVLICKALRIPTVMMHDYEHTTKTGFLEPDWILMPDVIPDGVMSKKTSGIFRYPGLKEDVYVPRFKPDASILTQLGIAPGNLVVTLRPPANEAHYHNPESEVLFAETLRYLAKNSKLTAVALPRNERQAQQLRTDWSELIKSGQLIVPQAAVNGLNLIWFSDLVISGGGTMNREAAALGVPVFSVFRGTIGAVDRYLAAKHRMALIESVQDIPQKIKLVAWNRPAKPDGRNRLALPSIVDSVVSILNNLDR
jgi:predicted glycosyltransferase